MIFHHQKKTSFRFGEWQSINKKLDFNFFLIFLFFNFTILYWFCHISTCICHRYTCVPHPEPSSLLPPHTISLGRPSAPAPSIQYHASILIRKKYFLGFLSVSTPFFLPDAWDSYFIIFHSVMTTK